MSGRESRAERIFVDWLESMVDGAPRIPFEDLAAEHRADADELRELHRDWLAFAPLLGEAVPGSVDGALPSLGPSGALPDESFEELFGFDLPESGRYRFRSLLGRGGGGVVLKVWDAKLDRALAMKVVLGRGESFPNADASSIDPQLVSRFVDEARIASQLDHPSIVPVHELGRDQGGRAFFTMRLVQGEDLGLIFARCWRGDPDWTLARIVGVLVRVSEALAFAHERGVLHRDLKPANVMVGQHGVVHVMDWGLARSASAGATEGDVRTVRGVQRAAAPDSPLLTGAGAALGTPAYMAPEQARGDHAAVDARTDVYAIGAMLYELLAQRPPYVGADEQPSAFEVIDRIQAGPPESLERVASVAPIELVAIAERAMAREPDARYAGMADLQADLRAVTEGRVVRALESGALAEARKWVRRNPALAGALAGVVVVASLGAGISLVQARAAERARLQAERSASEAREGQYAASLTAARFELVGGDVGHARRLLAAAPEERRGWEWDYLNAALDQSTLTVRGLGTPVWFLDVSPDGERVAAMRLGTGVDPVFERAVELFQTSDGTQIATLGEEKHFANGFEFSADGRSIVSSGEVMLPSVWDGLDGSLRWGARIEIDSRPPSFGFSHDSTRVAAAYAGGTIRVFAAGDGSELLVLESGAEDALQPTFSGDDRQVVALTRDGWIRSWDARTGEVRHGRRLTGYFSNLARIVGLGAAGFAVVADGKVHRLNGELDLLPLRYDGQALRAIYHEGRHALLIQTYRVLQLQPLDGIDPVVWPWISADGGSIAVDRQGSVIACSGADETSIGLFRPGDAAFRATLLGHTDRVSAMEFAGDSTDLVTASRDGTIRVWRDVLTARDAFCGGMGSGDPRLSACGRFAFGEQRDAENRDGLALWPVDGAGSSWTVVREEGRYLSHCALDATSARVAVLDESGRLEVRDAVHGGLVANAIDRAAGDRLVAFVPGRNEVLVADGGGTVYRYDVEGGALQRRYEAASDSGGNVLAAESDVVVLGRHDGGLACWDLESGALLWEAVDPDQPVDQPVGSDHFGYQASAVEQAVVGPGADVLAALHEDGRVRVLDLETGTDRYSLAMRLGLAECVAFHPTAARIAVGYADGAVRVFDQATGVERLRVDLRRGNVGASAVLSLGFTPDGSRLIAIHRGGRVETYDSLPASQRWHADRDNLAMEAPDRAWVEAAIAQSGGVDSLVGELRNGTVTHAAGVHAARVAVAVFVQSVRDRALELEIDDPNESSVLQRIATDPAWTDVERRVAARWFDDRDPESDRLAWRLLREIRVLATANRQQLRRLTDCARRIMELGTDDPTTLYHVGAIELEIFGEPAAALLALERAALASDNYEHDYGYDELERSRDAYLAMAHWRLGHPDAARAALASARGGPGGELSEEEERVLNLAAQMIEINAGND